MLTIDIGGLPVPDAGGLFLAVLGLHVAAGLTAVVAGALAATARKRPGRHPTAGRVYLWGIGAVGASAAVMAAIRWRSDRYLFAIAVAACVAAFYGWRSRRRRRPGWPARHAAGMGGSFIALLTGFYVDNGPHLPLWDRLPHWTYWVLPASVGVPLIVLALRRFRSGASARPRAAGRSAVRPLPPR
jgi:hypothetical protein